MLCVIVVLAKNYDGFRNRPILGIRGISLAITDSIAIVTYERGAVGCEQHAALIHAVKVRFDDIYIYMFDDESCGRDTNKAPTMVRLRAKRDVISWHIRLSNVVLRNRST